MSNLLIQLQELVIEEVHLSELTGSSEAVVFWEGPRPRLNQWLPFPLHPSVGQIRQDLRGLREGSQGLSDRSTRFARASREDGSQFASGVFQRLLDALHQPGSVSSQTAAVAGQIPQFSLATGRHQTGLQEAMLQQVGEPLGVLDLRFPPWHRLALLSIPYQ
jgi:hypothetical protein